MYYNNRKSRWLDNLGAAFVVLVALVALASFIYMRVLYATGEISHDDYARMTGQTPKVVLVR